ncbi:MAG TPA: helix-turn-helix transcriptional regulator [Stellaceae bacterium]|nr:helix-turn-helix transcriptional regulator [Stellaceae bacterium]
MSGTADPLSLIDPIYEAAVDIEAWPAAMTAIADALRARAMSLTIADPASNAAPLVVAPCTDPHWRRAYRERWAAANPVRERGCVLPAGEVYGFESLGMPRSEFDRTPFYNEFWAPQRLHFALVTITAKQGSTVSAVGFYRSCDDGRFARDEERLLRVLGPHLRRAVALNLQLAHIEMRRSDTAEMLNRCKEGALLVDAQARVLFANAAAEAILTEGAALRVVNGRLAAGAPGQSEALRGAIAGGTGGLLALPRCGGGSVAVQILPLRAETSWLPQPAAAILFVRDPRASALPSRGQIRLLFDLTPAQAAMAREILEGDGIQAAALRLGISRATARTHLLEVFHKTGTNRQAELVRVILQHSLPEHRAS